MCPADRGSWGFHGAAAAGSFRNRSGARALGRPPGLNVSGFILLCHRSLSEFLRRPPAPRLSAPEHYLPGFLSRLRRHRSARSSLQACFIPRRTRVVPFRDSIPIRSASRLVAGCCPRVVGPPALRPLFGSWEHGTLARHYTSTSVHPDFEASFRESIACLRFHFRFPVGRFPSSVSSSSRFSPSVPWTRFTRVIRSWRSDLLQRLADPEIGIVSRETSDLLEVSSLSNDAIRGGSLRDRHQRRTARRERTLQRACQAHLRRDSAERLGGEREDCVSARSSRIGCSISSSRQRSIWGDPRACPRACGLGPASRPMSCSVRAGVALQCGPLGWPNSKNGKVSSGGA